MWGLKGGGTGVDPQLTLKRLGDPLAGLETLSPWATSVALSEGAGCIPIG